MFECVVVLRLRVSKYLYNIIEYICAIFELQKSFKKKKKKKKKKKLNGQFSF